MSVLTIVALVICAEILQILIMLAIPYYSYKGKSVEDFILHTDKKMGDMYISLALLPFIGAVMAILVGVTKLVSKI